MCPVLFVVMALPVILLTFFRSWLSWGSNRWPIRVAFLHPYCAAGGGGERVLWQAVSAIQAKHAQVEVTVYTGDRVSTERLVEHVRDDFNIELPRPIRLVRLRTRPLLEARLYPIFTIAGQTLGSIVMAFEAVLRGARPHILIDTMGYSFTYPVFKCLQRCHVISYTHYPIVSSDMLSKVSYNDDSFNNRRWIARSRWLTNGKRLYYTILTKLYGWSGWFADQVMVNSSWTRNHIVRLWSRDNVTHLLFPPVDVKAFTNLDLNSSSRHKRHILSVAQFRPEKNHRLQLEVFAQFLNRLSIRSERDDARLLLIGSVRNEGDQHRVDELETIARQLNIESQVEFHLNVSFDRLLELMQSSAIGLHTMKEEHFGIGIVECMAAGLVMIAHDSGGPRLDIIDNEKTGFLATDCEQYVQQLLRINGLTEDELIRLRTAGRDSTRRFSNQQFDEGFLRVVEPFLTNEHELVHSVRL
jgi:alpha-1,2-mannosyltransferase